MKSSIIKIFAVLLCLSAVQTSFGQFNLRKAAGGLAKAAKAVTLTDEQMAAYVKESVDWMDEHNPVLPDGSVRVFSSLMDIMTDDELLGIIGHEIGHVMRHHSKNAFRTQLLSDAIKDGIASTGNKAAALTESQLGTLGSSLINAKYSQKQEVEADNCGYDFLKEKGKNPWGMVMAFEKFQKMEGENAGKSSYFQKMFSSHPETKSRIENMTKRCRKDGFERPAAAAK